MTDFKTALPVILVQPTCPGDAPAKGVQFQWTCSLCREKQKTQVWLCFLVLSFLSTSLCAASVPHTGDVQMYLKMLERNIEKSDAMLYAPSIDDIRENCTRMSLRCYIDELIVVFDEEEIMDNCAEAIRDFRDTLLDVNSVGCPPCEAYSLKNITVFLERLNNLLELITAAEGHVT